MGQEPRKSGVAVRALTGAAVALLASALATRAEAQTLRMAASGEAAAPSAAPPAYQDRVIEGLAPDAGPEGSAQPAYNAEGWPRFLRLETRLGTQPYKGSDRSSGFVAAGAVETPNHGTLSVDASLLTDDRRNAVTLRQRGLPMQDGWSANNELGVITPLAPPIMRLPARVFVPTDFVRGASTEWVNPELGVQASASAGQVGRLQGYPVTAFDRLHGNLTQFGAQAGGGGMTAAIRTSRGTGLALTNLPLPSSALADSSSVQVAARQEDESANVQANGLATRASTTEDTRTGVWVDGEFKQGRALYGWGFYRLDPNLSWNGQSMASNIRGAYARASTYSRQWSADAQVDVLQSIVGDDPTGVLVTGSGRWRYSKTLTLSAGGSFRRYQGDAGSAFADLRHQNDWGLAGVRADLASDRGRRSGRLTLDQAWDMPVGWLLGTSLTGGRETGTGAAGRLWGFAVSFSGPITNDLVLSGNASREQRQDGSSSTGANVNLAWRLSPRWSLEGNYAYSQGRSRPFTPVDPLAPLPDVSLFASQTRAFYVLLRYEDSAGTSTAPLGGSPSSGGGSIEGTVFLDANRSGAQEAGEGGAAGATVYLDGRFAIRTDGQGRFSFPFVAPGPHVITVLNETLPLPWEVGDRREMRVEVVVREAARVAVPVVRRSD
jgi:hypothetical protein